MSITEHINYPKVVFEQLRIWRLIRKPLLEQLDIEFMKALETKNESMIQEIVEKKNALRDITKYDFSTVNELDDIRRIWPDILGEIPEEFKLSA